jgi:hypothetical protein
MHDFWKTYAREIVAIAPRTEALETPIEDPKKTTIISQYGYRYTNTEIKVDESRQS